MRIAGKSVAEQLHWMTFGNVAKFADDEDEARVRLENELMRRGLAYTLTGWAGESGRRWTGLRLTDAQTSVYGKVTNPAMLALRAELEAEVTP